MAQIVHVLEDIYKVSGTSPSPLYLFSHRHVHTNDARAHEKMRSCCSREMQRRTSHKHGMYTRAINMACDRRHAMLVTRDINMACDAFVTRHINMACYA